MDLQSQIDQIQKKIERHEERITDVQKTVLNIARERKSTKESEPGTVGFGEWIMALLFVVLVVLVLVLIGWVF
uniref:Uncharacterized protein n=1 Tax=viral metagenome TaxID=1070528 RepID=A0A6M3MD47_9ZZZZ